MNPGKQATATEVEQVPSLIIESFAPPAGVRDNRMRSYCDERVGDALAGRTVWCSPWMRDMLDHLLGGRASVRAYSGDRPTADDIVVLDDVPLATEVRECGAHTVVHVRLTPSASAALAPAVDAYLVAWSVRGPLAHHVAAVMPQAGRVAEKALRGGDDLAWGSLLADVVSDDREERVGGMLHVRPVVAVR
jgi:hypothetical protein